MPTTITTQPNVIKWLKSLEQTIQYNKASVRTTLRIYVHPEGFGYFTDVNQQTNTGAETQPVANIDEACALFRAFWERSMQLSEVHKGEEPAVTSSEDTQ